MLQNLNYNMFMTCVDINTFNISDFIKYNYYLMIIEFKCKFEFTILMPGWMKKILI